MRDETFPGAGSTEPPEQDSRVEALVSDTTPPDLEALVDALGGDEAALKAALAIQRTTYSGTD